MNWWQQRLDYPSAFGFISPEERPTLANHLNVPDGEEFVWTVTCSLIELYELNIVNQQNPRFRLKKIMLLDRMRPIPLCPPPDAKNFSNAPKEVCSLGVCISHGIGEIWFVASIKMSRSAIDWRVDMIQRRKPVTLFVGGGHEERLERAHEYLPAIQQAWNEALFDVTESIQRRPSESYIAQDVSNQLYRQELID